MNALSTKADFVVVEPARTSCDYFARVLDAAGLLGSSLDLWQAQNDLLDAYSRRAAAGKPDEPTRECFGVLADKLNLSPSLLGQRV